ncbi:MAG: tRNA pseudouridine(13) synthase TruD, partial [Myxococcales bacterium]|nr:tRNA pseudouridine(13) synthase TruD [Myxococcales bacterium]
MAKGSNPVVPRATSGAGTRRVVRVRPKDTRVAVDGADISLAFELPSGAYATVVLREILKRDGADSEDTQRRDDDVQNAND